jgi:predicted nucleic acid-binding protein
LLIRAAALRTKHQALKMPDAIHAAAALENEVTYFVSNDSRISTEAGLTR